MGNVATTIGEQIELLSKRGMSFDGFSDDKIKEILLDIGYYRLGFYWHPFEVDKNHTFEENTKFDDVVELYYFDVNLRNILIKTLNRIEISFKTKLIYYVSNKNKSSPTWFVDKKVMSSNFINNFDNFYTKEFINNNRPIKSHHKKYINDKYAPAWKTLEFLTFGTILKIYENLLDIHLREIISKEYSITSVSIFINYMKTIKFIRNECAHGGILFDIATPKGIAKIKQIQFNTNGRHNLDACIRVILYFLNIISCNRCNETKNEINFLFEEKLRKPTLKKIFEEKIGYIKSY